MGRLGLGEHLGSQQQILGEGCPCPGRGTGDVTPNPAQGREETLSAADFAYKRRFSFGVGGQHTALINQNTRRVARFPRLFSARLYDLFVLFPTLILRRPCVRSVFLT